MQRCKTLNHSYVFNWLLNFWGNSVFIIIIIIAKEL